MKTRCDYCGDIPHIGYLMPDGDLVCASYECCYEYLREYDVQYSKDHGFPPSIKLTTVKPSGCRPWYGLVTTTTGVFTLEELFSNHIDGEQWSDFKDDIQVPKFTRKSRRILIECGGELDWSDINPDIFGSMFQRNRK